MEQKIKYFLYARKSSEAEDRQVASIDAQIDELKKLAKDNNLEILDNIPEAKSAKSPGRPEFSKMIERLHKGEANGILCWKLDRLARNPIDGGTISWMLQQGTIQHIQTFGRGYFPTDNVLTMSVEFGMANQYVRDLSTNVKRGLRKKLARGEAIGVAPEGYLNTPDREKGLRLVIKDPERFPLVRKMWDLMLTGHYSAEQVRKIANKEWGYRTVQRKKIGGRPLSRSAIYRMLANPYYMGQILHRPTGQFYKGIHDPMVTSEEFDKVQMLLGSKRLRVAPHTKEFAHTGQITCGECGCQVTAEDKLQVMCKKCKIKFAFPFHETCPKCGVKVEELKRKKMLQYTYYHCTKKRNTDIKKCRQSSITYDDLKKDVKDFLFTMTIKQRYVDWALEYLAKHPADAKNTKQAFINQNKKSLERANKLLEGLMEMRMAKEIDDEQYFAKKQALEAEKKQHEDLLNKTEKVAQDATSKTIRLLTFAERAAREYEEGDKKKKRLVISELGSNLTLLDKKLHIEKEKSLELLIESTKVLASGSGGFEPKKHSINKGRTSSFEAVRPMWLGSWDSNPGPIG